MTFRREMGLSLLVLFLIAPISITFFEKAFPHWPRSSGWVDSVFNNWEEYGYFNLRGKSVQNPGGVVPGERQDVYPGFNPPNVILALPYFMGLPFSSTGWQEVLRVLFMAEIAILACWWLLGKSLRAAGAAAILALTPGFLRPLFWMEPLTLVIVVGIAVGAGLLCTFQSPRVSRNRVMLLLFSFLVYSCFGWVIIYTLVPVALACLLTQRLERRKSLPLLASGIPLFLVTTWIGVQEKVTIGTPSSASTSWSQINNNYFWGAICYGHPIGWSEAVLRVVVHNLLALLPLLALFGWALFRARHLGMKRRVLACLPALFSLAMVLGMRNYYAHTPWSAPYIFVSGLVFSMFVLERYSVEGGRSSCLPRFRFLGVGLAIAFLYSAGFLAILRVNSGGTESLHQLVLNHTRRHDVILVNATLDKPLTGFQTSLDRRVCFFEDGQSPADIPTGLRVVWLTLHEQPGRVPLASSQPLFTHADRSITALLTRLRRSAALVRPTQRRLPASKRIYLYEVGNPLPRKALPASTGETLLR